MGTINSSPSSNEDDIKTKTAIQKNDLIEIETEEEEKKKYKKERENVLNKIKMEKNYDAISINPLALNKFADCLSLPSVLKNTYLNPNMTLTLALDEKITKYDEEMRNKYKEEKSKEMFSSKSEEIFEEVPQNIEVEDDVSLENLKEELMKDPDLELDKPLKIKLLITDIHQDSFVKKNLRTIMSPMLSNLHLLPEFGIFHTALIIGPWKIEWNDSGLCVPRKIVSKAAIFTADLDSIATVGKFKDIIDKLAAVITYWNGNIGYSDRPKKGEQKGNCQDFCTAILNALEIDPRFSGPMEIYLREMREKGKCEMQFYTDKQFCEEYKLNEKVIKFKTHTELDQFVSNLGAQFQENNPQEYMMLKSFDRAFWMKHLRFENNEKFQPLKKEKKLFNKSDGEVILHDACPFGDPNETRSFLNIKK